MRSIVVWFSDTHAGSCYALMNPEVVLYREDEQGNPDPWRPAPTKIQEYLWNCYEQDIQSVKALAGGDRIILVHNGDIMQGLKWCSELVSTREADQVLIAEANLEPWLRLPNVKALRLTQGTGVHGFGEGSSDRELLAILEAKYPERNIATTRHGLLVVDDVYFDYAHHGPTPGIRNWTTGNVLRHYTRSLMLDELVAGRMPPRVVIRSHYHAYVRETVRVSTGDVDAVTDAFVTPAYAHLTEYATQATRSAYLIGCGLVACEVVEGELREIHPFTRRTDLRRKEVL
jgi:hypothetical protein